MAGKIQAVLAPTKSWTRESFEKWLTKRNMRSDVEEDGDFWHARQEDPDDFDRVRTKRAGRGLVFRIGFSGPAPSPSKETKAGKTEISFLDLPIDQALARLVGE